MANGTVSDKPDKNQKTVTKALTKMFQKSVMLGGSREQKEMKKCEN